jgi:CheY-like chemotaxis protein
MNSAEEHYPKPQSTDLLAEQHHLRSLVTELGLLADRERKNLARELHDNLVQFLVVCRMKLGLLGEGLPTGSSQQTCDEIKKLLNEALGVTRTLMEDLRPTLWGDDDLRTAMAWVSKKMERHGVRVTIDDDKGPMNLDEEMLTVTYQSVLELLINVARHAHTGEAILRLRQAGEFLEASIRDSGCGFDLDTLTDRRRTGCLGLFNIQERLTYLGGRIEIASAPGEGTRVTLFIPLVKHIEPDPDAVAAQQLASAFDLDPRQSSSNEAAGSAIRVLLVDDHPIMREGLRSIIERHMNLEVIAEAIDGAMAIKLAREVQPDVVVMDVNMPVLNGIKATRQIKTEFPSMVVIGLSVRDDDDTKRAMRVAGAQAMLSKGQSYESLCKTILETVHSKTA